MSKETFYEEPRLIDSLVSFAQDGAGDHLYIHKTQEVPDEFLRGLAAQRTASTNERAGEFHQVASIPVAVVEHLLHTYNFDVMNAPVRETMAMLKRLHLDSFLATNKRI